MALTEHLSSMLEEASSSLPGVKKQRMFGCDGFFANDNIFGIIWKTGRIGLKFRDPADFDTVFKMQGTERWSPSGASMSQWLLMPESFHDDAAGLIEWVEKAHKGAFALPPKEKKPKKAAKSASAPAKVKPPVKAKATGKKPAAKSTAKKSRATKPAKKKSTRRK